jgi:hypothetical protein
VNFASLYQAAHGFLRRNAGREVLVVAMERAAADHVVRALGGAQLGIHRCSLRQLVAAIAEEVLMRDGSFSNRSELRWNLRRRKIWYPQTTRFCGARGRKV